MKKLSPLSIIGIILLLAVILFVWYGVSPGSKDALAKCISDSGTVFYGAFWCPHCQDQKKKFGKSADLLPYVECSTPDGRGQLPVCTEKSIASYPTWILPDGEVIASVLELERLAELTGCAIDS